MDFEPLNAIIPGNTNVEQCWSPLMLDFPSNNNNFNYLPWNIINILFNMEIVEKPGSQHMVKGKETNCVYKNVSISLLQNLSSVVASR